MPGFIATALWMNVLPVMWPWEWPATWENRWWSLPPRELQYLTWLLQLLKLIYQQLPLFVITADRPPEKINQFNNQIIDQEAPYYAYTKGFYQLPVRVAYPEDLSQVLGQMEQLFASAPDFPRGPVHLNVPLEEPLYDLLPPALKTPEQDAPIQTDQAPFAELGRVDPGSRILVLAGMGRAQSDLTLLLSRPGSMPASSW